MTSFKVQQGELPTSVLNFNTVITVSFNSSTKNAQRNKFLNSEAMNGCQNGNCHETKSSDDHCVRGKIFQTAQQIYVHTGNLTNWSRSNSKVVKSTTEEICERLVSTVNSCTTDNDKKYKERECVRFANASLVEKVKREERDTLRVSVKLFINEEKPHNIQEAIFRDLTELGVDFIDVVVLSIPPFLNADTQFSVIKPMWKELEKLVEQSYVGDIAVCDFSMVALKQLCEFAKIKPSYDQVNLASCCVMPQDLVVYAKETGINLLTHADPKDILPSEKLLQTINKAYEYPEEVRGWRYSWVTCYSVIIKCRAVLQNKGYIVNLVREV
ncbi:glutamate--cysteine ligase regulatory subunit-like [Dendronephthya gigantea]|uniref:glutamate--cysteine ligase regulatory subunit-like n=1 Tax=Dendronephthya gigantea TaxID=151771 RepID=UPI001069A9D9|nr:glutamate--cysteine ligase regulatory subunit-like [Dendronephthya gigantea]